MKTNKKQVILIIVAAIAIGATYFYSTQKNIIPTSTQVSDTTENWKTYSNPVLGFAFKYPRNWIDPIVRPQSTRTEIDFDPSYANLTLIIGFDYNQITGKNSTYSEVVSSASVNQKSQEDFLLDGIKGKKIVYAMGASTLDVLYIVPVPKESLNTLKIQYAIPRGDPDTSKLFDQILSTFKFMPASESQNYIRAMIILQAVPEIQNLQKDLIKLGRTTLFKAGDEDGDVVKIWLYEDGIPDGHITRIDTFNVNIKTKVITVDDVAMMSGKELITLEEWKKTVKGRFQ